MIGAVFLILVGVAAMRGREQEFRKCSANII